jgi:parvulin-like peptidyl-prolyl isomerase
LEEIPMKSLLVFAAFGWAAFAQSPLPPKVANDQVVAKIDGKDVTAGEVYDALLAMPPEFVQLYNRNPQYAVQQLFMMRYLSTEADKYQLADRPPYKQQLQAQRDNLLAGALLGYMQDHLPVEDDTVKKFYDEHRDAYQQARVKAIVVRFKPVPPPNTSLEVQARLSLEAQISGVTRTEEEARARAAEAAGKLKGGGDFAQLVQEYSEDNTSKSKGGDYGTVSAQTAQPDELKKSVAKLRAGDVSDPVRTANAFLIVRVEEKTTQPFEEVQELIRTDLRKAQINAWFTDVTKRFQPTIVNQEFFTQPAPVPAMTPARALPNR